MQSASASSDSRAKAISAAGALLFFLLCTGTSCARWANFAYRTFDLAYYVQALWQLIHGRFEVSVQYVPLLGNHVEPIVLLIAPIFFVVRHPMLFVVLQNAALATMGPIAYRIARELGFDAKRALLISSALLLAPATGYIALHEFHPEAFAAPFLLLMLHAGITGRCGRHWLCFLAVLACKENMAPLLATYCVVQCAAQRKRAWAERRRWFIWPLAVAIVWFFLCSKVITPAFNGGNIDYAALYERLGNSGSEIIRNVVIKPQLVLTALSTSLRGGNLVWGLLFPFLLLPLLRPKWLLIATPILLQHLLSWRSSEWTIYFHYAAPLLPLFWFASAEAIAALQQSPRSVKAFAFTLPVLVFLACAGAQIWFGPAATIGETTRDWFAGTKERARKAAFLHKIPLDASVAAPLPYLSHLAMREQLHSLHYILKGLKTLSRDPFVLPEPTEYVLIDYSDSATFDAGAGYYHPAMRGLGGLLVPSSDQLLHKFLAPAAWKSESADELTLLRRVDRSDASTAEPAAAVGEIGSHTALLETTKSREDLAAGESFEVITRWRFTGDRQVIPWMVLQLTNQEKAARILLNRGLCAPEAGDGIIEDTWKITATVGLPAGTYAVEALFFDKTKQAWVQKSDDKAPVTLLLPAVSVGTLRVR